MVRVVVTGRVSLLAARAFTTAVSVATAAANCSSSSIRPLFLVGRRSTPAGSRTLVAIVRLNFFLFIATFSLKIKKKSTSEAATVRMNDCKAVWFIRVGRKSF